MKNTLLANQFTYERLECWFWLVMKLLLRIYDWIFQLVLELCPHSRTGSSFDFKNWGFQFWNSLSSWIVSLRKAFEAESHGQCAIRSEGLKSRACGKVFSSVKSYIVGNNVVLFFFFFNELQNAAWYLTPYIKTTCATCHMFTLSTWLLVTLQWHKCKMRTWDFDLSFTTHFVYIWYIDSEKYLKG